MIAGGSWQDIAQAKQVERTSKIPKDWIIPEELYKGRTNVIDIPDICGLLMPEELDITSNYDATVLLEKLKSGELSSEAVTTAFCKRAAIAQQLANCLTEIFFEEAIARAKQLDAERKDDPSKALPPLWGLPISLKDSFQVPGIDYSCGIASLVNEPSKEYSVLSKLLVDLGAVLYVKTNVPQTLMTADSDNNVFGRTVNPHNINLTAGGSTGGEGALLALRGSILGVGTDIAGSVRIPALCNGIYSLRPSINAVPYAGQRRLSVPGVEGVKAVAGPMATSARDCKMFMKAITEAKPWDRDIALNRTIWQDVPVARKEAITIGVVDDYSSYTLHPPVRRALDEAVDKLKTAGVKVVPVTLPDVQKNNGQLLDFFRAAGNGPIRQILDATGEPEVPSVKRVGLVEGEHHPVSLDEYLQLFVARQEAQAKTQGVFLEHKLDAIISPGAPHVAVPHDTYTDVTMTGLWNYLDYPAAIVPVGKVLVTDVATQPAEEIARFGQKDIDMYRSYTGPDDFRDAPTAVQIIGRRQHDEELMGVVVLVDEILRS